MSGKQGSKRLNSEQRKEIQSSYASGEKTYKQLAMEYGISIPTVGNILREAKTQKPEDVRYDSCGSLEGVISNLKLTIAIKHQEIERLQKILEETLKIRGEKK